MTELTPRKKGRPPALTQKQKRFAELYVYSRGKKNLTQCAFEAGYKNRPSVNASELRNPRLYPLVCDYIKQLEKEEEIKFRINKPTHLGDLAKAYHKGMDATTTAGLASAVRAEELRGKVMGYYVNRNENRNINTTLDEMTEDELKAEFQKFYEDKMKDVTPKSKPIKSKVKQDPGSD